MAMLEIDARASAWLPREPDLDLAGLHQIRLVAPFRRDLPGDDEPLRRVPDEHTAPVTLGAVGLCRVTPAAFALLDNRLLHRRFADVVRPRPPRVVAGREDLEGLLDARVHGDGLSN